MAEIVAIDKYTWRIEDGFVRFFLLIGSKRAALIDSGVNSRDAHIIAEGLTNLPIMLINTHGDGDHVSGTGSFSEIYMAKEDYYNRNMNVSFPETKLVELNDNDVIDLGDRQLEIITIPGHTKGSIAILDISNRYLFAGDSVQSGFIFMFGDHRDPSVYSQSLNKLFLRKSDFDKIIASHDAPILTSDYIDKVLSSWNDVQNDKIEPEIITLYDTKVKSYKTDSCGFYCNI